MALEPSCIPTKVSTSTQIRLPAVVQSKNGPWGISSIPAGTEIRVRIAGSNRPQKTTATPWRPNQTWLAARLSAPRPSRRPPDPNHVANRSARRSLPTPYQNQAPSTVPTRPASTTGTKSSLPSSTSTPPRGMINSEGMGGMRFSSNMARAIKP